LDSVSKNYEANNKLMNEMNLDFSGGGGGGYVSSK